MRTAISSILALALFSCTQLESQNSQVRISRDFTAINPKGKTVETRFNLPEGFERMSAAKETFAEYLRQLPLKEDGALVKTYDGRTKLARGVYCAVVDMDIGKQNLQQCADAVMRLRGEYLFNSQQYEMIHFNFTNGFRVDYSEWMKGKRVQIKGNDCKWIKSAEPANTYRTFRNYMDLVFTYAGTLSLSKELEKVSVEDLQIGDVYIQGGSPGHAVIVVDMAENRKTGKKIFLLAQSYMPAQHIQILINPNDAQLSPWFSSDFGEILQTPEWTFGKNDLMRFPD